MVDKQDIFDGYLKKSEFESSEMSDLAAAYIEFDDDRLDDAFAKNMKWLLRCLNIFEKMPNMNIDFMVDTAINAESNVVNSLVINQVRNQRYNIKVNKPFEEIMNGVKANPIYNFIYENVTKNG